MNIRGISARKMGGTLTAQTPGSSQPVNLSPGISRRGFTRTAGGAAVLASTVGLWKPTLAQAKEWSDPQHIPGGTPVLGGGFHVFGPAAFDPVDAEPATITDLNGFVGLAYISGTVTRTNHKTGEKLRLPFVDTDMRFMQGVYKGQDGRMHQGAFAFVWVDVFAPGPGAQLHDLNPSLFPPTGLFWTTAIPVGGIQVNLGNGVASMEASNVQVIDYGEIVNALFGGGPAPKPASVSFKVAWSGVGERANIRNSDPVFGGYAGEFIRNGAQMEWSAASGDYTFASDPLDTSVSSFAEIGHERNGSFFP